MFRKDNSTNSDNQIFLSLISLLIHLVLVPDIEQECCVLTSVNGCLLIRWILIVLFCHHMTYHFRTLPLRSPRFVLIDQSFYSLSYSRNNCTLHIVLINDINFTRIKWCYHKWWIQEILWALRGEIKGNSFTKVNNYCFWFH